VQAMLSASAMSQTALCIAGPTGRAPPAPPLFQAPMMDWMTIKGMASASFHEAPLKATAKCSLGTSGSLTRTSEPVK
jgi:hypothetical protein